MNITGQWEILATLTSPFGMEKSIYADLFQDETGRVTGTVVDDTGEYQEQISGQVENDYFQSDQLYLFGTVELDSGWVIDYEADVFFEGPIVPSGDYFSGVISGQLTKPFNDEIQGTFEAFFLTSSPAITPTPSPTATTTPPAGGSTPTPTGSVMPSLTPTASPTVDPNQTPTPTPTCPARQEGNLNCDQAGRIDELDLSMLLSGWGTDKADISGDGLTNEADLTILFSNF